MITLIVSFENVVEDINESWKTKGIRFDNMFNVSMNDIQQIDDTHKEEHEDYKQESNGEDRQEKQRSKTSRIHLFIWFSSINETKYV